MKLGAGAAIGSLVGAPVTTEILHLAYTDIVRAQRNKVPKLYDYVPDASVAFGYWPHANDYFSYQKMFGRRGQIVGFFSPNTISHPEIITEMANIQNSGHRLMVSFGFSVKDPKRYSKCRDLAKELKKLPEEFMLRPNCEMNQHSLKKLYQIDDPEEFIIWWEEMYNIFMEEGVNCEFVFAPNTTEDILNTDQIKPYIPRVGVHYATLDAYKRHRAYPHYKYILPDFSAYELVAHDVAVLQEELPGIPFGFTEFGSEENEIEFKTDLLRIAPYLGAQFVMSFEWDKSDPKYGDHERDWRSIKNILVHRAMIQALNAREYMRDTA